MRIFFFQFFLKLGNRIFSFLKKMGSLVPICTKSSLLISYDFLQLLKTCKMADEEHAQSSSWKRVADKQINKDHPRA
jgi:hypothetical protein